LLKVFVALMEQGSVTTAAAHLQLAQSSLSHALSRLRDNFGNQLFVRTGSGMQPTPFALEIYEPLSQALVTMQAALKKASDFDAASSDRVLSLIMTDVCQLIFLPTLLGHIREKAPKISIIVHEMPRRAYRTALEEGKADLAIGQLPQEHTDFFQQRIFNETYCCVMRAKHPLSEEDLTLDSYLSAEHLAIGPPAVCETMIQKALGPLATQRGVRLHLPNHMVAPFTLAETDLIAVLPRTLAGIFLRMGGLVERPVPFEIEPIVTRQFWHERSHDDKACRWLRQTISALFAQRTSARTRGGA
ncbi:MAG: LysR family transcriptional regulator, partial [Pirellulales bacterium]|nr:LysR family transcriptional regulator [Pirellulales bacterium]